MHKTLVILALFSVGCTYAVAGESGSLRLSPLAKLEVMGDCVFQLKGTESPEIVHFAQFGLCSERDAKGRFDLKNCDATSVININNNQMTLRNISMWGYDATRYKNNDYVVEMKFEYRDCRKVSCTPFYIEALLTVKKGSLRQTFDMQGYCRGEED